MPVAYPWKPLLKKDCFAVRASASRQFLRTRGRFFLYETVSRPLVLKLKHGDRTDAAVHLARWMRRSGADLIERCDIIVPVPLHRWRLFMRTYNQSTLLANALSKLTGVAVSPAALSRTKATRSQGGLDRKARRRNVGQAFSIRDDAAVKNKRILLVDDVLTTGATANACARALLRAGAASVDVLVLARVPPPGAAIF
jgi:ComF family protein